jgi:hypothetical protein
LLKASVSAAPLPRQLGICGRSIPIVCRGANGRCMASSGKSKAAGVTRRFHSLLRLAASYFEAEGRHDSQIGALLGHADGRRPARQRTFDPSTASARHCRRTSSPCQRPSQGCNPRTAAIAEAPITSDVAG